MYISFLDSLLANEVEYLVYDLNGIVAAVGGGLGLFLGFSVFSVATKGIQALPWKKCSFSQRSKVNAKEVRTAGETY